MTVETPAAAIAPDAKLIAILCGVGAAACWGVGLVAARHGIAIGLSPTDLAFHRFIWEKSGNRTLYRTLDQIAVPLFAFVAIVRGAHRQSLKEVVQSHEGIIEALRHPSTKAIRQALRQHFWSGLILPD